MIGRSRGPIAARWWSRSSRDDLFSQPVSGEWGAWRGGSARLHLGRIFLLRDPTLTRFYQPRRSSTDAPGASFVRIPTSSSTLSFSIDRGAPEKWRDDFHWKFGDAMEYNSKWDRPICSFISRIYLYYIYYVSRVTEHRLFPFVWKEKRKEVKNSTTSATS